MSPIDWLLSGDTGISSKTICMVMTGSIGRDLGDTPKDNSDFGRCYRLLLLFPEWRRRLPEVAKHYPAWGPIVKAWDELSALYETYCDPAGHVTTERFIENKDTALRLYNRLKELNDEGLIADGWTKDGPGSWSRNRESIVQLDKITIRT